jgi:hypothetical protein
VGSGGQVVITSVDAGPFPPEMIAAAKVWQVHSGQVTPCG